MHNKQYFLGLQAGLEMAKALARKVSVKATGSGRGLSACIPPVGSFLGG